MTSLQNAAFEIAMDNHHEMQHSDETSAVYDTRYAIDMIEETIRRLNRSKIHLEASIASNLEDAKTCYTKKSKRKKALVHMQRVHRHKVQKEIISTALFQLVAVRIELELKQPHDIISIDFFWHLYLQGFGPTG